MVFCFSHKNLRTQVGQCPLAEVVKIVENETIPERKYIWHQWNGIIRKGSEYIRKGENCDEVPWHKWFMLC